MKKLVFLIFLLLPLSLMRLFCLNDYQYIVNNFLFETYGSFKTSGLQTETDKNQKKKFKIKKIIEQDIRISDTLPSEIKEFYYDTLGQLVKCREFYYNEFQGQEAFIYEKTRLKQIYSYDSAMKLDNIIHFDYNKKNIIDKVICIDGFSNKISYFIKLTYKNKYLKKAEKIWSDGDIDETYYFEFNSQKGEKRLITYRYLPDEILPVNITEESYNKAIKIIHSKFTHTYQGEIEITTNQYKYNKYGDVTENLYIKDEIHCFYSDYLYDSKGMKLEAYNIYSDKKILDKKYIYEFYK